MEIKELEEKLKKVKGSDHTTVAFDVKEHNPTIFLDLVIAQFKEIAKKYKVNFKHKRKIKFRWSWSFYSITDEFTIEGAYDDVLPFTSTFSKEINSLIDK